MRLAFVVGTTETATIPGISAAGADSGAIPATPAADAEILAYGRPVFTDSVPVSPTGCPTPALVTRAVLELTAVDPLAVDAGLGRDVAVPTLTVGDRPGGDVRGAEPVPNAGDVVAAARAFGREYPDDELVIGESVPGGTTTALGVLAALGEDGSVSSSLPENPLSLKREVVGVGLDTSGLDAGDHAGAPVDALRSMGDPVLAAVFGLVRGAIRSNTQVILAGGSQMLAVCALLRHGGVAASLTVATTTYVAADDTAAVNGIASDLDVDLVVTDPGFDRTSHDAMVRYPDGEAKDGAGMGGSLALAEREGVPMAAIRDRVAERYDELVLDVTGPGDPA